MGEPSLTEFLLARVAEDEAAFRWGRLVPDSDDAAYDVLRWDDERGRAECEAKRVIAHLHGPKYPGSSDCKSCADGWEDQTFGENGYTPEPYPCLTARNLAAIYSDHPQYRAEWRP